MEATVNEAAVRRYLSRGIIGGLPEDTLAAGCNDLIQETSRRSLRQALPLARRFARRAETRGGVLALTAYRALARITHLSGMHSAALDAYLKARHLARRDASVRARIDRALIEVYMYLGDFARASRAARRAIATFTRLNAQTDLAQARVNCANLYHRRDRHRNAERLYRQAAEYFESIGNQLAAARCCYNQANTLVQLFDFDTAEKLYRKSHSIYAAEDCILDANDTRYGLAWLRMLAGDFHTALLELSACEKVYREGGDPRGEALCMLDRSEVFLGLGLYTDTREVGRAAERMFTRLKLRYERAKSSLYTAQAAHALGAQREARSALERARAGFTQEKNHGFLGAVHLLAADMAEANGTKRKDELSLARASFARAQLPLWQAVCDLKETADPRRARLALGRLEKNGAVRHVPHLFAIWQTALGDYEFRHGDLSSARRHWRDAADRLDAVRAQLPPVELRSAYARKQSMPHTRLIALERDYDPTIAAAWSERYKTAGLWSRLSRTDLDHPSRQRAEESLGALARRVAALANQIGGHCGARGLPAGKTGLTALSSLQKQLREQLIGIEKSRRGTAESIDGLARQIRAVSRRLPIVQFHVGDKEIVAFVHDRGETALHSFPDGRRQIELVAQRWRYILESELLADHLGGVDVADVERTLWRELGDWLWSPLEVRSDAPLVLIIPEGELSNVPWQALLVEGRTLSERHQFILAPSIRHYSAACSVRVASDIVEIFRGRADRLPYIDRELSILAEKANGTAGIRNPCRRTDWPSTGEFRIWHYAGHANFRADNPFYSSLLLEDGPLFAVDFRLKDCRVGLTMLASCRSGEQMTMPGEEATGLVRSLLEMGSRNVVAAHWPVSDRSAALWMEAFYERLFDGDTIHGAAQHAAHTVRDVRPSAYHWAAFSAFGAGKQGD